MARRGAAATSLQGGARGRRAKNQLRWRRAAAEESRRRAWHDAAMMDDIDEVRRQLAQGADVNQRTTAATPLYYACRFGHVERRGSCWAPAPTRPSATMRAGRRWMPRSTAAADDLAALLSGRTSVADELGERVARARSPRFEARGPRPASRCSRRTRRQGARPTRASPPSTGIRRHAALSGRPAVHPLGPASLFTPAGFKHTWKPVRDRSQKFLRDRASPPCAPLPPSRHVLHSTPRLSASPDSLDSLRHTI